MATSFPSDRPVVVRPAELHPIRRHPIHGILAAYPLAFFTGALVTDIVYANSAVMQWANFSAWQLVFGLVGGVAAAIVGLVDALLDRGRNPRRRPWPHSLVTLAMLGFALVNSFVHARDAWTSVVPTGLVLSAITALLALVSAWLGYSLEQRQEAVR